MSLSKENLRHIANAVELLQTTLKCAICLEMLREPVSTRCGHHFCTLCINNLLNHKRNGRVSCPLCSAAISRRAIVENDKIKRQVDGVIRVLKAIEADTGMDITALRQIPSSTFEANSPVASPPISQNEAPKENVPVDDFNSSRQGDSPTPKKDPPQKLSSAEKVKTWLIQNDNNFENKTILNEFSTSKPSPCDEDSDNEMISVSQVAASPTNDSGKKQNKPSKYDRRPAARRSLKIKEINLLTSSNSTKSSDDAFDRLLQGNSKTGSPKLKDKPTASKTKEYSVKKKTPLCIDKNKILNVENTAPKSPVVLLELMEPQLLSPNRSNKSEAPPSLPNIGEPFLPHKEMPPQEPVLTMKNIAQKSKKPSPTESQISLDSCDIVPPSECGGDVPISIIKHAKKDNRFLKETQKKSSKSSTLNKQAAVKRVINQKVTDQPLKKQSTSVVTGGTLSKASCSVSKRCNVSFLQLGRIIRERRFLPAEIRCYCMDKLMFLLDLNDSSPRSHRTPPSPKKSQPVPEKELQNVGSQASPRKSNPEPLTVEDTAMDTDAADARSEDMFPISPEKNVQSGDVIPKRCSNSSSEASDNILDAATVVFTQPPVARSLTYDVDCTLLETEKSALKSPSESLLGKKNEEPGKKQTDTDEESVGGRVRKSSKRPRRLSSSDDSDDGEEKIAVKKRRKKKSPLSDSGRNSIEFIQEELPLPSSLLDQTIESPQRLVQGIKAKIAAGMLNKTDDIPRRSSPRTSLRVSSRASPRDSPGASRIRRQMSKVADVDLTTPPRKKPSSDSDLSDCELLEGTPQQQTSINISRRSLKSPEGSFSKKALNTTVASTESCTPGFIEASQPPLDELPPSFGSKKSEAKTSWKGSLGKDVSAREAVASLGSGRSRADKSPTPQHHSPTPQLHSPTPQHHSPTPQLHSPTPQTPLRQKCPTPQRPLREKNTTEEQTSNKTFNNISTLSTKEDRLPEKKKDATPQSVQKQAIQTPKKAQKLCFVCSGLTGNFTALVQKLAALVGADFSSKFDSKATHLVVKTKENNTTDKTLKFLCAVAAKKWVVSFQWVVDSIKEGKLLPEEKYEVLDTTGAEGPRLSRLSSKLLFSGFEFCIFPPLSDITKQQLEELVETCGATVVSDPKKFSFRPDVLPLCLAEYDEEREQEYAGWIDRYCVPLVQHEWILDCIGRFSLVSFWNLLMSDVSDDSLRSMGYPPHLIEHPPSDSTEME